jgi:hypothetical protein
MLMTFNPAINGWAIFSEACRVMAKRLRDVCALPESECSGVPGRGFVVRDPPWTIEKLRHLPDNKHAGLWKSGPAFILWRRGRHSIGYFFNPQSWPAIFSAKSGLFLK